MNKDLKKIADYYGCEAQRNQLIEEMAEVTAAINRPHRAEKKQLISYDTPETEITELSMNQFAIRAGAYEDVVHEIADVEVCLKQVKYLMEIDKDKLKRILDAKIARQLKRIEEEQKADVYSYDYTQHTKRPLACRRSNEPQQNSNKEGA